MGTVLSVEAEQGLNKLCAIYSEEGSRICVFTGAGVSFIKTKKYKTPGWWDLLGDIYESLGQRLEGKTDCSSFPDLKREYPDPWKMADFFEETVGPKELSGIICRALNKRVTEDVTYKRLPHAYLRDAKTLNATIAFCSQIRAWRKHQCLEPNNKVQAVITINYDCFLEAGATTKYQASPFGPVASKDSRVSESQLPVYHIHGYAPYGYLFEVTWQSLEGLRGKGVPYGVLERLKGFLGQGTIKGDKFVKSLTKQMGTEQGSAFKEYRGIILDLTKIDRYPRHELVMSTESYRAAYSDENGSQGFAAKTLVHFLTRFPTLFIGVSFNDGLLVKILRSLVGRDKPWHFALVKQEESPQVRECLSGTKVSPIFYPDHEQVPTILEQIYRVGLEPVIHVPLEKNRKQIDRKSISRDRYWDVLMENKK